MTLIINHVTAQFNRDSDRSDDYVSGVRKRIRQLLTQRDTMNNKNNENGNLSITIGSAWLAGTSNATIIYPFWSASSLSSTSNKLFKNISIKSLYRGFMPFVSGYPLVITGAYVAKEQIKDVGLNPLERFASIGLVTGVLSTAISAPVEARSISRCIGSKVPLFTAAHQVVLRDGITGLAATNSDEITNYLNLPKNKLSKFLIGFSAGVISTLPHVLRSQRFYNLAGKSYNYSCRQLFNRGGVVGIGAVLVPELQRMYASFLQGNA